MASSRQGLVGMALSVDEQVGAAGATLRVPGA
jgi:hypothetical protein